MLIRNIFCALLAFLHSGCSSKSKDDSHIIASIPEASGIDYCKNSGTLVIANDEGSFYEIKLDGAILKTHKLGDYDLEGVVCEEDRFIFAVENGDILVVDRHSFAIEYLKLRGIEHLNKKTGIEGIVKIEDGYLLTAQTKKHKKDAIFLVVKLDDNYATVTRTIHHGIIDSAGMDYNEGILYIVSDTSDKLYLYHLKDAKIIKEIILPPFDQEGIALDDHGNIFFTDDKGSVMSYTLKELGL